MNENSRRSRLGKQRPDPINVKCRSCACCDVNDERVAEQESTHVLERLLTYKQVGEIIGMTDRTVFELVKRGGLRAVRIGRSVRVDPADLRAYIDRAKIVVAASNSEEVCDAE